MYTRMAYLTLEKVNLKDETSAFIRHFYGIKGAFKLLGFAINENDAVTGLKHLKKANVF